ncbi:hypothetical protein GALMADRAFT_135427 [Galerina marginata CBS 339.88]|uniref:F-box domain-containing protein n=1 Tax=Galerina marginata (strain CBS 339.88) TaxID=685588 RepID=A0A067TFY8_GALM3|nr:hypothetical protein GALMADRAFT_135427 [Galerina marginata CBS 339.88]
MSNLPQDLSDDVELARLLQKKRNYQAEREALELRIKEIDYHIIDVQAEYGAIYNRRASVLKLPAEVTGMIFSCAVGHPMEGDNEEGRHSQVEIVVSHVCHQWRTISLAFPHLWASFCYDGPAAAHVPLDRLDAYLERSVSQPLELWLDCRDDEDEQFLVDNLVLMEKTLSHIARWKRVTVVSDSHTPLTDFISAIETASAPNLEYFTFCCDIPDDHKNEPIASLEPGIFTNGAPNLKSVMLDCSSYKCVPPLSNVSTLRLEAIIDNTSPFSWKTFREILSLPHLANFSILGEIFEVPDNHTTVGLIAMNNLKHLRYSETGGMALLLPYFRAPLLETLILQNDALPEEFGASAELYIFPSLRSVSLIEVTATSPLVALHFAAITESATEILFSQEDSDDTIFMTLLTAIPFSGPSYWTQVKLLTCNSPFQSHITQFITFAKPRSKNGVVLRIFSSLDEHWKDEYPDEYDELTEACTIEAMDTEVNPLAAYSGWPPGDFNPVYLHDDEDPFYISPF